MSDWGLNLHVDGSDIENIVNQAHRRSAEKLFTSLYSCTSQVFLLNSYYLLCFRIITIGSSAWSYAYFSGTYYYFVVIILAAHSRETLRALTCPFDFSVGRASFYSPLSVENSPSTSSLTVAPFPDEDPAPAAMGAAANANTHTRPLGHVSSPDVPHGQQSIKILQEHALEHRQHACPTICACN